ncbi:CD109 antigen-like [Paramacrobiotus metropolitanus]|uniref:CD109 antigen-like n=1 Tax=Paramacrobiotus metropolitanus TaxID=2943436 RepID=UPI0024457B77|nr:CD109 antigen-like [Paramacrobiotus metropolitanus]
MSATAQSKFAYAQMEASLLVKAEGVEQYRTQAVFIDLRNLPMPPTKFLLQRDPLGKVTGSDKIDISITGDILGLSIQNLEKLIKLPYASSESSIALTASNVAILKYLTRTNKLIDSLKKRLINNTERGYQRVLEYRHADASFSKWGSAETNGSTWVTAHVAKALSAASVFTPTINNNVIRKAFRFLRSQRNADGSFQENEDTNRYGDLQRVSVTAVAALSFLQYNSTSAAGSEELDKTLRKAVNYLEDQLELIQNDSYVLAMTAYALTKANSPKKIDALSLLKKRMVHGQSSIHWTVDETVKDGYQMAENSYSTSSKDVEATAYALLNFLANKDLDTSMQIVSWLISKQNAEGGFFSAPDTSVALEALAASAKTLTSPPSLQGEVADGTDGMRKYKFTITPESSLSVQDMIFAEKPDELSVHAEGSGVAVAYLSSTCHVLQPREKVSFDVNVTVKTFSLKKSRLDICVRYQKDGASGTTVAEVNTLNFPDTNLMKKKLKICLVRLKDCGKPNVTERTPD